MIRRANGEYGLLSGGERSLVIIDVDKIATIDFVAEMRGTPYRLQGTTEIYLQGGGVVQFSDDDLPTGWTHHHLLVVLGWDAMPAPDPPTAGESEPDEGA